MLVYIITNQANGKIYIGKTTSKNLKLYFQKKLWDAEHPEQSRGRSHLFAAIRKYGRGEFTIKPLFTGASNEEICTKEIELIAQYDSRNPNKGYNICKGGEGRSGPLSPEAKVKFIERTPAKEALRKAGLEQARQERGGSFLTEDSVEKIKTARADQDEAARLSAFNEWKEHKLVTDPDHFKKIGAAASREDKARAGRMGSREDKQRAGRIAAKSLPKAIHTRWHVNRGKTNPECPLCRLCRLCRLAIS